MILRISLVHDLSQFTGEFAQFLLTYQLGDAAAYVRHYRIAALQQKG